MSAKGLQEMRTEKLDLNDEKSQGGKERGFG